MKIDIEDVYKLKAEIRKINDADINKIEFYLDNKKVNISKECIRGWKFTGLSNYYFIADDFWKERK